MSILTSQLGSLPMRKVRPIASVVANLDLIEAVRATVIHAVQEKRFDDIARAFVATEHGGNVAIRSAIQEIGTAVVASAAYAALGGSAGLPNPDDTGPIPHTLSPVVHIGRAVHRVTELPRLQQQLAQTVEYVAKAVAAQAPRGDEIADVRAHLEGALNSLPKGESAKA